MKLTEVFERVTVLNLPYKEDRKTALAANFVSTGIVDPKKVTWQSAVSGDNMWPPAWWNAGNGAWGCLMSHVMAVQQAAIDGIESILILEDDAVFEQQAAEHLGEIHVEWPKKWGQIYLGGQHLSDTESVSKHWLKPHNVNRTHAFALHKSAFAQFVAHVLYAPDYVAHKGGWHVDHQLGLAHERSDWPVFCPKWWLAGQAAGSSNISALNNPEQWWQPIPASFEPTILLAPQTLKNSHPAYQKYCHAGRNLYRDTCEDTGADKALKESGGITRFLDAIVGEATWHHRLPIVQHPGFTKSALKGKWSGEVRAVTSNQLPALHADLMEQLRAEVLK